jgi:hypothetical protein
MFEYSAQKTGVECVFTTTSQVILKVRSRRVYAFNMDFPYQFDTETES